MKVKNLFDTKKKKIIAGSAAALLILSCAGVIYMNSGDDSIFVLTTDQVDAEFGQKVSVQISDYLDVDDLSSEQIKDILSNTTVKDGLKYVTVENKDSEGNVVSKEEKDYPEVGEYKIDFTYKAEKKTVNVTVKDTTEPTITAPDTIDIVQYTDLSTFNFGELLIVEDYSDVDDWEIDTSKVDVNTVGTYELIASIQDKYKNKASKTLNVNVVVAPELADDEVAVTEIVTDENGNKKTVVTKKASSAVSASDLVASSTPVQNTGTVNSSSNSSATKPSNSSGQASTTKPDNDNSSSSGSSSSNTTHTHNWVAVTKTVHHDAETKVVHHDAVTKTETVTIVDKEAYDEPVYETHQVCKVCGEDFGKGSAGSLNAGDHSAITGHSYTSKKVQVDTIHHDAVTHQETKTVVVTPAYDETVVVKEAYDETVTTGYKCSCGATK